MSIQILGRTIEAKQLPEVRMHLIKLVEQNREATVAELERVNDSLLAAVKRLPETDMLALNARTDEDAEWLLGQLKAKLDTVVRLTANRHAVA